MADFQYVAQTPVSRREHASSLDSLTGLANRKLFLQRLAYLLDKARPPAEAVAVLLLDLDRFKHVNDVLGHAVGDRLLIAVAQRMRDVLAPTHPIARLGDDEFTVALVAASPGMVGAMAGDVCRSFLRPFHVDGQEIFVAASIGIAMCPNDGVDAGTLMKHADMAMVSAKHDGGGFRFFDAVMARTMCAELQLETDLRHALERDELLMHYQPKWRVPQGSAPLSLAGAEALVRWRHPSRGLLGPGDFVHLAEETGLIVPLGEWVLLESCRQIRRWIGAGRPPMPVAVNVSVRQMLRSDFAAFVAATLASTGIDAQWLQIEITESMLMTHGRETLDMLGELRSLGVRLAVDDFGTGYSSLAYLRRLPVDTIKIDRSFICDVPEDADGAAIVAGIVSLAHRLRLDVVAEGVETAAQVDFLRDCGCDQLQGYLLGEPVAAASFDRVFLSAHWPPTIFRR